MYLDLSDEELMELVAEGDEMAFQELAVRARPGVKAFLSRLGCGVAEGDDLAQEALIRLWLHRGSYVAGKPLRPYLLTIAKNAYLSHCERRATRAETVPLSAEPSDLDRLLLRAGWQVEGPEAEVMGRYREYRLARAVADLPTGERLVFVLKHHEGMRYADIAAMLGIAEGTVKSRMFRAVRLLRKALPDLDPDGHQEEV
ncbi:MAG: RNA polymerase sigma factor [Armatimonadetes bacterium]|nr:RNA polymerase sigma factor [Armatimonadota bacterium]